MERTDDLQHHAPATHPALGGIRSPLRCRVGTAPGTSLLREWLASRFRYLDAAGWQAQLAAGRVRRNGAPADADCGVAAGDDVEFTPPAVAIDEAVDDVAVLFADADLVVVAKPPHRVVQHASTLAGAAFLPALARQLPPTDLPRLEPAHRLDRETSGVLVLARSALAVRALQQQFTAGVVTKGYVAVVTGRVPPSLSRLDGAIGPAVDSRVAVRRAVVAVDQPEARPACTELAVAQQLAAHAVLTVTPRTGRTHQIRVHLATAGHPIVGDKLYGRSDAEYLAWVERRKARAPDAPLPSDEPRLLLHAARLHCRHPRSGDDLVFTAPWPTDLAAFVVAAGGTVPNP